MVFIVIVICQGVLLERSRSKKEQQEQEQQEQGNTLAVIGMPAAAAITDALINIKENT
jgi:hypothetical protein